MRTVYAETVEITNVDHDQKVTAQVVHFVPENRLIVEHSGVEITMMYEPRFKNYIGTAAGLEFISKSPTEIATYRESRR